MSYNDDHYKNTSAPCFKSLRNKEFNCLFLTLLFNQRLYNFPLMFFILFLDFNSSRLLYFFLISYSFNVSHFLWTEKHKQPTVIVNSTFCQWKH